MRPVPGAVRAPQRRHIESTTRAALAEIAARQAALHLAAQDQALAAATDLAPGLLSAGWDGTGWDGTGWDEAGGSVPSPFSPGAVRGIGPDYGFATRAGSTNPLFVRVGQVAGCPVLPAVLPLLGSAGWAVHADAAPFARLAAQVTLRLLAATGSAEVRIQWAGSADVRVHRPGTSPQPLVEALRAAGGRDLHAAVPPTIDTPAALTRELQRLEAGVERVLADPEVQAYGSLLDAARVRGRAPHRFQVLVLDGVVLDAAAASLLARLLERGPAAGLTVLLRRALTDQVEDTALLPLYLDAEGGRTVDDPPLAWTEDPPPPPAVVGAIGAAARRGSDQDPVGTRAAGLEGLVDELSDRWLDRGVLGVRALLGHGRAPLYLELRSGAPRLPHALVAGAAGQGVTNALLVIVHTLAAQYAPGDLELVLLGSAEDDAFAALRPGGEDPTWLPHLATLGVRLTQDTAATALAEELGELARRSSLIDRRSADDDRPRHRVESGPHARRVIVIDDLHQLTGGPGAAGAHVVQHLLVLARRGPAVGMHLVLGTHDAAGLTRLAEGAALLELLPSRIALPAPADETTAVLGSGAPITLCHPGDIAMTTRPGVAGATRTGAVPYVDPALSVRLRRALWLAAPPASPPTAVGVVDPTPSTSPSEVAP